MATASLLVISCETYWLSPRHVKYVVLKNVKGTYRGGSWSEEVSLPNLYY